LIDVADEELRPSKNILDEINSAFMG
jgi:hypothetical protein